MNPIQQLAIADQPPTCSKPAQRQGRHNAHRHTIRRVHMARGQRDHGFRRFDRERVDDQRGLQQSNAHKEDQIRNGHGASNSQGCCEPASAAILLKQPTCPTSCKTPGRYSSPLMNPRMRGCSPQLQLLLGSTSTSVSESTQLNFEHPFAISSAIRQQNLGHRKFPEPESQQRIVILRPETVHFNSARFATSTSRAISFRHHLMSF